MTLKERARWFRKQFAWFWAAAGVAIGTLGIASTGCGEEQVVARGAFVNALRVNNPAFMVRLSLDHPDHVYVAGDRLVATVRSSSPGYLYLLYRDANGKVSCLFPNSEQKSNEIAASVDVVVPPKNNPAFEIEIGEPFGEENISAIVSKVKLEFDGEQLRAAKSVDVDFGQVKGAVVRAIANKPGQVAEHTVSLRTVPRAVPRPAQGATRRVGLFIGIGAFQQPGIRPLPACKADATTMKDVMQRFCGVDQSFVLLDNDATLENIVKHIQVKLVEATKPGDTVFIYWSGHGTRIADDNGDETDGFDELLLTHDTVIGNVEATRRTALIDDHFGRLLQDLDGRKICLILDTCHSGGQAANEKGLLDLAAAKAVGGFDMLDEELKHAKDVGQKETAMLVSSRAAQISFVRREGDLSVMTKVLGDLITNAQNGLTLKQAVDGLKEGVPAYVGANFPGATQTPELFDFTTPPFFIRKQP